ncbi:MAG: YafY family transcriptional regulator [Oscillospiraceae bacterium]|jgi:predicted DNA-binding transcriptional regulator YafY|nr:YafY family transcriptional regulator [Oscillospiraceae bacterium]
MKLDRLLGILTLLLQNERVTAPELARRFEVNRRTIGRDIDALCQAGIPVVTRQGAGGGISIAEGFKLDKSVLTAEELSGIIAALKGLGSVSERSNIERTLDKLRAHTDAVVSLREPVIIDLASHYKGELTGKIELIKRAVLETRMVEFDYFYEKGESHRRIEPYFVIFQWTAWYVFGFCHERQDWRLFKLQRLWNLALCADRYSPREIPSEKRDFNARFSDDTKLVALFTPSERYKLVESYGLNCYTETADGLRIEIGFTNKDYIISWLLGFGGKVRVLEPEEIAQGVRAAAQNILSGYIDRAYSCRVQCVRMEKNERKAAL